jgi:hypothetical protein
MLKAKEIVDKVYPDATASLQVSTDGIPMSTVIGGFPSAAQQRPVYDAQDTATQTTSAPPATPTAAPQAVGTGADMRATQGSNTTPQDLIGQGMNPNNIPSGMPTSPASFTGGMGGAGAGQITPEVMSRIADSAFQTGVMAQVDFDQLLATQPPENRQAFTDAFRRANITIQADAPSLADSGMGQQQYDGQTPQSIYAKLPAQQMPISNADLGSQPMTRQTLAQTQPRTITRIQQKTPNVSPAPAETPEQAGRRALLARATPAEEAAKETARLQAAEAFAKANEGPLLAREVQKVYATKRAEKDADFLETYNDTVSKSRNTLNALDQMIGDARIERDRIVIPKGGRRPHGGFEGVVGAGIPGVRFIQGTQAAGFDALLEQVQGGAFLKAFNDLRGGGAITQPEGEKATIALTRVNRAQSEIEFVKAAREFVEILRNGIKNADKRYTRLTGEAPEAAPTQRKTPTSKLSPATRAKYGL